MDRLQRILIAGNREAWQNAATRFPESEIRCVPTYQAAVDMVCEETFHAVMLELWLSDTLGDYDLDNNGTHDGLELILAAANAVPMPEIVVIGESVARDTLYTTPGVPGSVLFISRLQSSGHGLILEQLLANEPIEGAQPLNALEIERLAIAPPAVGARQGRPRILIVEDQPFWQDTLVHVVEEEGYFWRLAPNHSQALGRLQLESFHMVLLNLSLGDMREHQGWHLLDYLVERCPKTRLLVISGYLTSAEMAKLFMDYPVRGFIDKNTFNQQELVTLIQQQITGPAVRIRTLGDFRIWRDGKLINDFGHPLAEAAIKLMLTRLSESVSADEMIQYLWSSADRKSHQANLKEVLNAARLALEPDLPRASDSRLILRDGSGYRLDIVPNLELDADRFKRLVNEGRQNELQGLYDQALQAYETGCDVYQGDYLPNDRGLPWTLKERTALQTLYTEALNRMADLYARQGKLDMAIKAANRALATDPYVEGTYRRLMRFHACQGEKAAALSVYKALVKIFSEFIDEQLSPTTKRLYEEIVADRPIDCFEMTSGQWRMAADRQG